MGFCESTRAWRCQGFSGTLWAFVGALLLGLSLAQSAPPNSTCGANVTMKNLTQPQYKDIITRYRAEDFVSPFVHSFLQTVQPNPFPEDLILKFVEDAQNGIINQEHAKEALIYQVGFLVCAVIGILYIVLMPIIGSILACCCCCGNCGGKMQQKQSSSINCRRRSLYWSTFITTAILLLGNIIMFKSNNDIRNTMDQGPDELIKTLDNMDTFLSVVPQQVSCVVNESYKTVEEVTRNLDAIGTQLGGEIQNRFSGTLDKTLRSVNLLNQETVTTNKQLDMLNSSLTELQSSVNQLQDNVTNVKNQISETIRKDNCVNCATLTPELQKLALDISISTSSLDELQSAVGDVIKINLTSQINKVEDFFNSIPQTVSEETVDVVEQSKQLLSDITTQISSIEDEIPLSSLADVAASLDQVQSEIDKYTPEVQRLESIRWKSYLAVCSPVLLVVVCNVLGLLLGPIGLNSKVDPTKRSCTADCGGIFFMMGAGFSFIFSWLLMILVLVLFLVGGNVYTLVCRPWDNGQLLKFIDNPDLIPGLDQSLGLNTSVTISEAYGDCLENKTLWETLHLYDIVDLEDLLNVSKYTDQIQEKFDKADITLPNVTILSTDDKSQLGDFSTTAKSVDFSAITKQMNNISSINLNTTADELDRVADGQTDTAIQTELRNESMALRKSQIMLETSINHQLETINSTLKSLRSSLEKIDETVGKVLDNVEAAQHFLDTNTTLIVETESQKYLDCQLDYFILYADWANITITQEVGRCGEVAKAVESVDTIVCSQLVDSLHELSEKWSKKEKMEFINRLETHIGTNAFWFSLGWCLFFFIPSIIFSIKLAKYYRKMKYSDVFDDHIPMHEFPRAQVKYS